MAACIGSASSVGDARSGSGELRGAMVVGWLDDRPVGPPSYRPASLAGRPMVSDVVERILQLTMTISKH